MIFEYTKKNIIFSLYYIHIYTIISTEYLYSKVNWLLATRLTEH